MKTLKTFAFALFTLLTINVLAQNSEDTPDKSTGSSEEAELILKEMTDKYVDFNTFYVEFRLQMDIPEEDADQYQEGNIYIQDKKFKLDIGNQQILTDGKTTCTYMKDIKELQITNFEMDEDIISPSELFTSYNEDFVYRIKGETTDEDGNALTIIEATPVDKEKPFFKIELTLKSDYTIVEVRVFEKSGTRYTYNIQELNANPKVAEDFFTCDAKQFPDAEVVEDLR